MSSRTRRVVASAALLFLIVTFVTFPPTRRASAQVAPTCAQVPSGIVSWYPGEPGVENEADDIVGSNDGVEFNGVAHAPGKVGNAFSFDGVDDYIEVGPSESLNLNTLTIDAWINRKLSVDARIVDKISTDANDGYALDIVGDKLRLFAGGSQVTGETTLEPGINYLVAGTFDGTNLRVYVNGALDGTTTLESGGATPTNFLPLHIATNSTTDGNFFVGQIDEVELFNRALSQPEIQLIVDADSAGKCRASRGARVIISEFRFRGPGTIQQDVAVAKRTGVGGASKSVYANDPSSLDEFIDLYNASDSDVTVSTTDGSLGWALAAESNAFAAAAAVKQRPSAISQNGVVFAVIANGTVIPARAHFLVANDFGYSLSGYRAGATTNASPDLVYGNFDIPDDSGIALFATADESRFSFSTRLDAAGFAGSEQQEELSVRSGGKRRPAATNILFFEDTPITNHVSVNAQHSYVRRMTTGFPQDTENNAADFQLVATDPTGLTDATLGAPGPENLSSPLQRSLTTIIKPSLLEPCAASDAAPNRVRDTSNLDANNHMTFGSLIFRRRFTNNSGQPVTRLRFRVVDITTLTNPPQSLDTADLRAVSSSPTPVPVMGQGCEPSNDTVLVQGLTLEEPPFQGLHGGGLNSSLAAGTITLDTPLAPGASVPLQFVFGVERQGTFRAFVIVEASFNEPVPNNATARAKQKRTVGDRSTPTQGAPKGYRGKRR